MDTLGIVRERSEIEKAVKGMLDDTGVGPDNTPPLMQAANASDNLNERYRDQEQPGNGAVLSFRFTKY